MTGWRAELLFGEAELLVPAKALVNGTTVRFAPCDIVRYVHVLFDRHQLVTTSGLISESFYPGSEALKGIDREAVEEILALFPELAHEGYGQAVRSICSRGEGRLLGIA